MLGASYDGRATRFTVWAPDYARVELVVHGAAGTPLEIRPMTRNAQGYWTADYDDVPPGALYRYRLDESADLTFPDPASRWQPHGVHGPSAVVDPRTFHWTDDRWQVPPLDRLILYELHVGTFTAAGTFDGVSERLEHLASLGVTAIELMPVADFPGRHNWGYDGAALFAPARCYGPPDSLRALVDAAHRRGIAVILDVVYNHFGPDGAYAAAFSPYYFSDRHTSPWGRGINVDGPHSAEVRRFFVEDALRWVEDYHVDGLRLDATHAIVDDGTPHFLAELTSTVRAESGREVLFIAEDDRNLARLLVPVREGGYGVDAVWADDFHHHARVHTAGDRDGYYVAYGGSTADIATTLRQGWFYTGQVSAHARAPRGTDPAAADLPQFVLCIQNHDQVGNRADGARIHHQVDAAVYRALSVLLLMAPHTPLLFMGQEWAAGTPFQFFTDHHEELGRQVTAGRRAEFASFRRFGDADVPDPQQADTFDGSRLQWTELDHPDHARVLALYRRLIAIRQTHPAMRPHSRDRFDVRALDAHTLALCRMTADAADGLIAIVRLSGAGATVPADAGATHVVLTTEDPEFAATPAPILFDAVTSRLTFEKPGAAILSMKLRIDESTN